MLKFSRFRWISCSCNHALLLYSSPSFLHSSHLFRFCWLARDARKIKFSRCCTPSSPSRDIGYVTFKTRKFRMSYWLPAQFINLLALIYVNQFNPGAKIWTAWVRQMCCVCTCAVKKILPFHLVTKLPTFQFCTVQAAAFKRINVYLGFRFKFSEFWQLLYVVLSQASCCHLLTTETGLLLKFFPWVVRYASDL